MRRTLALFLAVLILSLSLYVFVFAETNNEKDNVTVTEKYVYGDKSYAEKVDINIKMLYCENLLWDITHSIGDGKTETDFSIHKNRIDREYDKHNQLNLYTMLHYSSSGGDGPHKGTGLNKAYEELIKNAEAYVETKKTILLSDYIDYYPITVDLHFPDKIFFDSSLSSYTNNEIEEEIIAGIQDFFKIPVLKDHKLVIGVQVDENGNVHSTGSYGNDGEETFEDFSFYAESVITDDACFIKFSNRTCFGNIADTSEIPGGYGIYRLPYQSDEKGITFDVKNIENVFPVDENEEVQQLKLSTDKKDLYMISQNGNRTYLTVIDAKNYKEKSKIILSERKGQVSSFGYIGDDFMVINHYHENYDDSFSVYLPDGKGSFTEEFTSETFIEYKNSNTSDDSFTLYAGGTAHMNSNIDVKWDGENLYVTNTTENHNNPTRQEGFSLSIYNKNGLQFCGSYTTGLSAGYEGYQFSGYYTHISNFDLVEIKLSQ